MPCNRCDKIISQLKEDPRDEKEIIKDLTNCKECSEKILARCHTCHWPIYNHYSIYKDSGSLGIGNPFVNFTRNWELTQCDWCHKQWITEKKKAEKQWKQKRWGVWLCEFLLLLGLEVLLLCLNFFSAFIFVLIFSPCLFVLSKEVLKIRVWKRKFKSRKKKPKS